MRQRAKATLVFGLIVCCQLAGFDRPAPSQTQKSFAAVSIRIVQASSGNGKLAFRSDPASFHAAARSLSDLIAKAYGIEAYQILGGESWTQTERFDLDATTETPATPAEELTMLQQALVTRFGLRLTRERKMTPVFALVVAKGGPKFQELAPGDMGTPPVPAAGEAYAVRADTIPWLVFLLNRPIATRGLGRHVIDQTGLTGRYGLWLRLDYDPIYAGGELEGIVSHYDEVPRALKEIGLELKPIVAPVEFLTIQGAHLPTAN